jgi:hypothetical protein
MLRRDPVPNNFYSIECKKKNKFMKAVAPK